MQSTDTQKCTEEFQNYTENCKTQEIVRDFKKAVQDYKEYQAPGPSIGRIWHEYNKAISYACLSNA